MRSGDSHNRSRWIAHLEALTGGLFGGVPFDGGVDTRTGYIEGFRDEFGNRRASDRPFLAYLLGATVQPIRSADSMGLDERLWWCVARREPLAVDLIAPSGGLLPDPDALAIEYRTMVELGALHALWALALLGDACARERALDAARWNVRELQPDNAINRPWGLAVFVELALTDQDAEIASTADLHAQTLLHNACINFGKPDLLSALILRDCARQIRSADQCDEDWG